MVLLVGLLLPAGCGREPEVSPPVGEPAVPSEARGEPAESLAQEELDAVESPTGSFSVALIVKTRNNPFFDPMIKAAEETARELGVQIEIQAPAQETDKERQFALVQEVTARGVDAILIAPADSRGIVPALKQASDKGILIINVDNRIDEEAAAAAGLKIDGYVGADNEAGGRLAGEALARALPEGSPVAVLEGIRGADNAEARKRGFEEAASSLRVVASDTAEWDTQKAYDRAGSMLAAHPELRGIFCANDKMAVGAVKAISEAGKKGQITVVGYDNIPDVKPLLQSGALFATIEQHPGLMGRYGVRLAAGIKNGSLPRGGIFLVPLEVIRSGDPATTE